MSGDADSWIARARREAPSIATAALPVAATPPEDAPTAYRAWGKGHPEARLLDIRMRPERGMDAQGELLPMHYLMSVTYTHGQLGDTVTLAFADRIITARGRHLAGFKMELVGGKIDFLEQFDPARWGDEPGPGMPVILAIDVIAPGRSRPS